MPSADIFPGETETKAMRKINVRILPLVVLLYFISYIDRANVAYAKLTMSANLGFSEAVYGLGAGIFFAGYVLLEIPGGLIVHRWGARAWFARILITWGFCTIAVGMVHTPRQFYVARFLLGVAEAGLVPGMIVYLNQWFPSRYRAGAMAHHLMAAPLAFVLGGPMAGMLLGVNWLGLPGWRWVFILEGVPAILLGVATMFLMCDRPEKARWLSLPERDWVVGQLREEKLGKMGSGKMSVSQGLRQPVIILLSIITFVANIGIHGFYLWLPTTVQRASGFSPVLSSALSGLPFVGAILGQQVCGWSSDRNSERVWHTAIPLLIAGIVFPTMTVAHLPLAWLLFWLSLSAFMIFGFGPSYWTLPTMVLGESAAAASVGLLNSCGALGGFVGPTIVGHILTAGYSFSISVSLLSLCFIAAGFLTMSLRSHLSTGPQKRAPA